VASCSSNKHCMWTFLIFIKKCVLSCCIIDIHNNNSHVASIARSFCKCVGCLVLFQIQALLISTHIHALKTSKGSWASLQLTNWQELKRFFSSVPFFCFFSFLWFLHVFQGSGFFLFTSYFSRSSTMDVFPTMGRHILTSHASNIYSLALLSEVHFPVLDKCMKLVF
jgi:hypothetical protein